MQIAILLYDRFTALDAVGPYEVLSRLPEAEVTFIAERPGLVRTDTRRLAINADAALADLPRPDIVLVPGGFGQGTVMDDGPVHEWLRAAHEHSTWTTSVCTGSLILAAAGLLRGRRATSHWLALEQLRALGVEVVKERYVFDGKFVTAAGVSAGIDMALALAARIAGEQFAQAIQLGVEYDPDPPFAAGSPARAPEALVEAVRAHSRFAEGTATEQGRGEGEPLLRPS
jgi:transcriptional regulator GlxA family with amidase domain